MKRYFVHIRENLNVFILSTVSADKDLELKTCNVTMNRSPMIKYFGVKSSKMIESN